MTERKMKDGFWMLLCAACLLLSCLLYTSDAADD